MQRKIGYLGPLGTYSYEATLAYGRKVEEDFELTPFVTISEVILAVNEGKIDKGIVPIENSVEGAVSTALDTFSEDIDISVEAELVLPIREYLLGKSAFNGELSNIKEIISHPQPLGQCRRYLSENLKMADTKAVSSTTAAIEEVLRGDGSAAAIGSHTAADLYNMKILAADIQDEPNNSTRFVVISKNRRQGRVGEKTSIIFATADETGSLYKILSIFNLWDLNLTRIESRPSRKKLGEYLFFVDIAGQADQQDLQDALTMVKRRTSYFKDLGSYTEL